MPKKEKAHTRNTHAKHALARSKSMIENLHIVNLSSHFSVPVSPVGCSTVQLVGREKAWAPWSSWLVGWRGRRLPWGPVSRAVWRVCLWGWRALRSASESFGKTESNMSKRRWTLWTIQITWQCLDKTEIGQCGKILHHLANNFFLNQENDLHEII